jgi:L-alanine-DL-glutamate epimerase-like enolase superfamily enzyme
MNGVSFTIPNKKLFLHMLQIQYKNIQTPFQYPFVTAHGTKTHQAALLIAITMNGITGYGEAPAIHYYQVSVESMIDELLAKISILQKYAFTTPDRFWHFCHHLFPENPFLVCALDMAYWDMFAKIKRQKIYEIWNLRWEHIPLTDYTIGMDNIEGMLEKIKQHPMPIYKIKVGNQQDAAHLKTIRAHTDAIIRIDANASWTLSDAIQLLPLLEALQIELIEQPFAKEQFAETKQLRDLTAIPIIADESCVSEKDVAICAEYFDGINIKLTKCGGITPAFRMIQEAKKKNLKVMMGCMSETEIGTYAIAQFLPLLDYVDMDGPLLLQLPPLKLLKYEQAQVSIL